MKTRLLIVCMVLLLCGCKDGSSELDRGLAIRTRLLNAKSCSFDADITADYGDRIHQFSLSCTGDDRGGVSFAVTEPESISGIEGTIAHGEGKLAFAETALAFDPLAEELVSPVAGPWVFLNTLRGGYLTCAGMEGENLRLTINEDYEEDALQVDIWLDGQDNPFRAEILHEGRRILTLEVANFVIS